MDRAARGTAARHRGTPPVLTPRAALGSIEELVAGATGRRPFRNADGKSGSSFERVEIDGERLRAQGHARRRRLARPVARRPRLPPGHACGPPGLLDALPGVDRPHRGGRRPGVRPQRLGGGAAHARRRRPPRARGRRPRPRRPARGVHRPHGRAVGPVLGLDRHGGAHAAHHPLVVLRRRHAGLRARAGAGRDEVPAIADAGLAGLRRAGARRRAPARSTAVRRAPWLLADAVAATPSTFLHGDWKMGNLGSHPDGRTILIDCAYPGEGPACHELGWYLAINRARLPESKEDDHRPLPGRAGAPRRRHRRRLVGAPARPVPARHARAVRLGEGAGRRRRAGLVDRPGARGRRAACDRFPRRAALRGGGGPSLRPHRPGLVGGPRDRVRPARPGHRGRVARAAGRPHRPRRRCRHRGRFAGGHGRRRAGHRRRRRAPDAAGQPGPGGRRPRGRCRDAAPRRRQRRRAGGRLSRSTTCPTRRPGSGRRPGCAGPARRCW